jgi:hypothetical protein
MAFFGPEWVRRHTIEPLCLQPEKHGCHQCMTTALVHKQDPFKLMQGCCGVSGRVVELGMHFMMLPVVAMQVSTGDPIRCCSQLMSMLRL